MLGIQLSEKSVLLPDSYCRYKKNPTSYDANFIHSRYLFLKLQPISTVMKRAGLRSFVCIRHDKTQFGTKLANPL